MDKVIKLLNSEKQRLTDLISFYINEIETAKAANKDLQNPEFVERNKDHKCWSENWTIQDFIELNVDSNNRAIEAHSFSDRESVEDFEGGGKRND